jgi:hypothetical protein
MSDPAAPLRIVEETAAYSRVLFDNPPLNIVGTGIFESLQDWNRSCASGQVSA